MKENEKRIKTEKTEINTEGVVLAANKAKQ